MASSQDTEITLGTGKLLFLFFGLVAICSVFFSLGYMLGRKSDPTITTASAAGTPRTAANGTKPAGNGSAQTPPMTFYKAVEQKEASPELTPPASDSKTDPKNDSGTNPAGAAGSTTPANPEPVGMLPGTSYYVQVAAVSKQEDADALVDALKKKQYPALVSNTQNADKLFRVQVGPFGDVKEAEATRAKLIGDGYNPILKK